MKKNTSTPFVQLTQDEKANKLKEIELYLDDQNNILLVNLEFIMTNKCNGNCSYCFEADQKQKRGAGQPKEITWDIMETYLNLVRKNREIRKLPDNEPSRIIFFGGEPMLKKDLIIKCLKECKETFWCFTIISNGTIGWDEDFIQLCQKKWVDIQISIDGNLKSNSHRLYHNGEPMFFDTYKTLMMLKNYQGIMVSSVVSEDNIENLYENFCFLEKIGIPKIQFFLDRINVKITDDIQDRIINQFILIGKHICEKIKKKEKYSIPLGTHSFLKFLEYEGWRYEKPKRLFEQPDGLALYIVGPDGNVLFTTNEVMSQYQNVVGRFGITKESILKAIKEQFLEPREYLNIEDCKTCICQQCHFPQCEQNLILQGCFKPTCFTFRGECIVGLMMIKTMSEVI